MLCPVCHTKLKNNATSCPNCGMIIKKKTINVSAYHNKTTQSHLDNIETLKEELHKVKTIPNYKIPKMDKGSFKLIAFTWLLFGVWGLIFILMVLRHYF